MEEDIEAIRESIDLFINDNTLTAWQRAGIANHLTFELVRNGATALLIRQTGKPLLDRLAMMMQRAKNFSEKNEYLQASFWM
jgi:hypothetical protein